MYAPDKGFIYTVETEIFVACTQMIQLYFQGAKYEPKSVRIITALLLFLHFLKQDRNILAQFALSIWTKYILHNTASYKINIYFVSKGTQFNIDLQKNDQKFNNKNEEKRFLMTHSEYMKLCCLLF